MQLTEFELLSSPFQPFFDDFCAEIEDDCLICSPYISRAPVARMIASLKQKGNLDSVRLCVITDISILPISMNGNCSMA